MLAVIEPCLAVGFLVQGQGSYRLLINFSFTCSVAMADPHCMSFLLALRPENLHPLSFILIRTFSWRLGCSSRMDCFEVEKLNIQ
jgi:hypothetical protein